MARSRSADTPSVPVKRSRSGSSLRSMVVIPGRQCCLRRSFLRDGDSRRDGAAAWAGPRRPAAAGVLSSSAQVLTIFVARARPASRRHVTHHLRAGIRERGASISLKLLSPESCVEKVFSALHIVRW